MIAHCHAVGRLTLRRDGWFSFDSSSLLGILTTTPVPIPTKPKPPSDHNGRTELELELVLVLNLLSSVRGVVRAELIDTATSLPLAGHSLNESVALVGHNDLQAPLRWSTAADHHSHHAAAALVSEGASVVVHIESTFTKLFTFELVWRPAPPPPPPPPVVARSPTFDTDIIDSNHGAYRHSYPSAPWLNKTQGALSCQSQCDADHRCAAWTYVERSTGHNSPERCCFAASVGCPRRSVGVVSGAKVTGPCTPTKGAEPLTFKSDDGEEGRLQITRFLPATDPLVQWAGRTVPGVPAGGVQFDWLWHSWQRR